MGRWLRHSYYPNWNLRLFRHSLGQYEKLTDANTHSGDNEVHEHVIVQGVTGRLSCEIDHYAFPSIEVFVEKHNRYSNWEARVSADRRLSGSAIEAVEAEGVAEQPGDQCLERIKLRERVFPDADQEVRAKTGTATCSPAWSAACARRSTGSQNCCRR